MGWTVVGSENFDDDPDAVDLVVIVAEEAFEEVGPADPGGFGPPREDAGDEEQKA